MYSLSLRYSETHKATLILPMSRVKKKKQYQKHLLTNKQRTNGNKNYTYDDK